MLHRDIKPVNIIVKNSFFVKICDLGLAQVKNAHKDLVTNQGKGKRHVGTITYMTPELFTTNCEY